jgi:hypothetical protein
MIEQSVFERRGLRPQASRIGETRHHIPLRKNEVLNDLKDGPFARKKRSGQGFLVHGTGSVEQGLGSCRFPSTAQVSQPSDLLPHPETP